jgi:hypothetical protein
MANYIIDNRLKFKSGFQSNFIKTIKNGSNFTWKQLSDKLGISIYTIRIDWRLERSTIPYSKALELLKLYPFISKDELIGNSIEKILPPNWGQLKGGEIYASRHHKKIKIPSIKKDSFAEFIGIMLGDGHLSKEGIEISLEYPLELEYASYVYNLIYRLFDREPIMTFKKGSNSAIYLILNSKPLVVFLNSISMKIGNKVKNQVGVPDFITEDLKLTRACIRGLIDTDGGIFEKQRGYKRSLIEFKNFSKPLKNFVEEGLTKLGFKVSKGGPNSIRIQNQDEIYRYYREIGFSNVKNLIRFDCFKNFGKVPNRKELISIYKSDRSLAVGHKHIGVCFPSL